MDNLNHTFRVVWNQSLQVWQAVAETASSRGKTKSSKSARRAIVAAAAAVAAAASGLLGLGLAQAADLPTGAQVVGGQAQVQTQGRVMTVQQGSDKLAVDWQSFNVGQGHTVNFVQPNAQAVALNRVLGSDVSLIQGAVNANGKLFLVNPNGILFTPTARVDVGSLVASTLNISPADFMAGKFQFEGDSSNAVENQGQIRAAAGGAVALIAARIVNTGEIHAPGGDIAMGAGRKVRLDLGGAVKLDVQEGTLNAMIEQGGALKAADGRVYLSARSARDLVSSVINQTGLIEANSLSGTGGLVALEADQIALGAASKIDATGAQGGGTVLVGGDWQGSGALRQASQVSMAAGAVIDASATQRGDGGKVVLWSDIHRADSVTDVRGTVLAQGGAEGGNGGQVETSGRQLQINHAFVSTRASQGRTGDWLLDPGTIDITSAGSVTSIGAETVASGTTYITPGAIEAALDNNNVTIQTGAGAFDLYVNSPINYTGTSTSSLTLEAGRSVVLNASITNKGAITLKAVEDVYTNTAGVSLTTTGANAGISLLAADSIFDSFTPRGIALTTGSSNVAGGHILLASDTDNSGMGTIDIRGGFAAQSNGGNITLGGGNAEGSGYAKGIADVVYAQGIRLEGLVSLSSAGGDIALRGKTSTITVPGLYGAWGVGTWGSQAVSFDAGSGKILMDGTSTVSGGYNYGLELSGASVSIVSSNTASDAIVLKGTGYHAIDTRNASSTKIYATGVGGGITLESTGSAWASVFENPTEILAKSGPINWVSTNNSHVWTNASLTLGSKAGTPVTTSSSNVLFRANNPEWHAGGNTQPIVDTTGTFTWEPVADSFSRPMYSSWFSLNSSAQRLSGLTIGKPGNTAWLVGNTDLEVNGPIAMYAGTIELQKDVVSTLLGAPITFTSTYGFVTTPTTPSGRLTVTSNGGNISLLAGGQLDIDYMTVNAGTGNTLLRGTSTVWNTVAASQMPVVNGSGSFTIQSPEGSNSFQNFNTNWIRYNLDGSSFSSFTAGKAGNAYNMDHGVPLHGASERLSVAGPISLYGGMVRVESDLTSTAAGDILLKGIANSGSAVHAAPGVNITKTAGEGTLLAQSNARVEMSGSNITASGSGAGAGKLNVVLWSDFDGDNTGGVSSPASITTNGGHVWMGGSNSVNGTSTWSGLTVGDGPSVGFFGANYNAMDWSGTVINTNGGNVLVWAGAGYGGGAAGISLYNGGTINSGTGNITLIADQVGRALGTSSLSLTTTGHLTLAPDGGSYAGTLDWSHDGNFSALNLGGAYNDLLVNNFDSLSAFTLGRYTGMTGVTVDNTSNVTLSSAVRAAGPVSIYGGDVAINSALSSTASGAKVLVKATGHITSAANTSINTVGGDLVLWSDSDNNAVGGIQINKGVTLDTRTAADRTDSTNTTGGGVIVLAGGLDDGGTASGIQGRTAGDGRPDGYAANMANTNVTVTGVFLGDRSLTTSSASNVSLRSGGGDINIFGAAAAASGGSLVLGIQAHQGYTIDAGTTGHIYMDGRGQGSGSFNNTALGYDLAAWRANGDQSADSLIKTVNGNIVIAGTAYNTSTPSNGNAIGIAIDADVADRVTVAATGTGSVSLVGTTSAGAQAMRLGGMDVLAASGDVNLIATSGRIHFKNESDSPPSYLGAKANSIVPTSTSNILVRGDALLVDSTIGLNFATTGHLTVEPYAASFSSALNTANWALPSTLSALTLGKSDNTANITVGSATTVAGPISIYGGNIGIDAVLTATGNNTVSLTGSGSVTDGSAGAIVANQLVVLGGNVTLDSATNNVGTLAASGVSGLTYVDSDALTIGTVSTVAGITATGPVSVSTRSGDLTLSASITTTNTTSSAITLNAGSTAAAGSAAGGNIVVTGTPSLTTGTGGRATLFTGDVSDSSSLLNLTGLASGSGHFRYNSDESTRGYTTALDSGLYAIYREQPLIGLTGGNQTITITYGDATPTMNGATVNGDVGNVGVQGNALSGAGKLRVGTYNVGSADLTALGYGGGGTLQVARKAATISGIVALNKTYDASTQTTLSTSAAGGWIVGDNVAVQTTGTFNNKNVGNAKLVTLSNTSYIGGDVDNYTFTDQASTTANVTPRAISIRGITAANKQYDATMTAAVNTSAASGWINGDAFSVSATGAFDSKNIGTGKTVTLTSTYAGADVGNYTITSQANTSANVTAKPITIGGITAVDKVYDGSIAASLLVSGATGWIGGDDVALQVTGQFDNKNVGTNKVVTLTSALAGADVGNYTITNQANTTANVTARTLTASVVNAPTKTYDGNTTATLNNANFQLSNVVAGEGFGVTQTSGSYNSKDVLTASTVTSNLAANQFTAGVGTLASNYVLPTVATGAGQITPRAVSAVVVNTPTKTYDGNTAATLGANNFQLSNVVNGEAFTVTQTSGSYNSQGVSASTVTSNLGANHFTPAQGAVASNYVLPTVASGAGVITARPLTITADDQKKITGEVDPALTYVLQNFVQGDTLQGQVVRAAGESVGEYAIDASGLSNSNYQVTYINGALTVTPVLQAAGPLASLMPNPLSLTSAMPPAQNLFSYKNTQTTQFGGMVLIPVKAEQLVTTVGGTATASDAGVMDMVQSARSMGFSGMLVLNGGVSLPAQAQ